MELQMKAAAEPPAAVTDQHQVSYRLAELLGEGGQGAVFRTPEHGVAIKLIYEDDPKAAHLLDQRLGQMRTRPLWDWPISRPFSILVPGGEGANSYNGYVMDLRDGAVPISRLIGSENEWDDPAELIHWYNVTTGGLRRRLVLLASAAETLAWLRAIPFVYADPSPNNILISKSLADEDVWLIDPDNIGLRRRGSAEPGVGTQQALTVFTPGYAAPEVVGRRSHATTLSDAFAFAVIAFEVLTLRHPFVGDVIDAGSPDLESEAYAGKWPWIDHPTDTRNKCAQGLRPRSLMLNKKLQALAHEAFGAGRDDPAARPGVGRWADELRRAAEMTLPCRQCQASFYPFTGAPGPREACPWCGAPRDGFALMMMKTWVGPQELAPGAAPWRGGVVANQTVHCHAIVPYGGLRITRRHALAGSIRLRHEMVLEVRYAGRGLEFAPRGGEPDARAGIDLLIEPQAGAAPRRLAGMERAAWQPAEHGLAALQLHFGPLDRTHRIAQFVDFPAP